LSAPSGNRAGEESQEEIAIRGLYPLPLTRRLMEILPVSSSINSLKEALSKKPSALRAIISVFAQRSVRVSDAFLSARMSASPA